MTEVSFRDAAVISYLTRHEHIARSERDELVNTLEPKAQRLIRNVAKAEIVKSPVNKAARLARSGSRKRAAEKV